MRGRDEDVAQPVAVGADPGSDPLLVDVEQTLLVDHLDGHGLLTVRHHDRACTDGICHVIEEPRRVRAAPEEVAVPAAIAVAVDVRVTWVVVAVVLSVDVGLLEREPPGPVVLRGVRAVGRVASGQVTEGRRREAGDPRPARNCAAGSCA